MTDGDQETESCYRVRHQANSIAAETGRGQGLRTLTHTSHQARSQVFQASCTRWAPGPRTLDTS